jgi:Transposase DDE domain
MSENTTNLEIDKLIEIFIASDDFCKSLEMYLRAQNGPTTQPTRVPQLAPSEIMTILSYYHLSGYKCFQYYYERLVKGFMLTYFPNLVSYNRFVELIFPILPHMYLFTQYRALSAQRSGLYIIDSKKLPVCHNLRIASNKVFKDVAARGKSSTGWFYGLKIHLIINHLGEIVNFQLTPGNVADNNINVLNKLLNKLEGICLGDKGYLTQFFEQFYLKGIKIVTKIRSNMKNKLMPLQDRLLLKKRNVIESVNDILMTVCDIEHTRHRNPYNAMAHIFAALTAYSFLDNKPALILNKLILA